MNRKFLFLVVIWFALGLTQYACDDCDNEQVTTQFWVKDIGTEVNYYWTLEQDSSAYYHYDSTFLTIFIKEAAYASINNNRAFSIINTAMACEPPYPRTDDKIRNIVIIASNNASDSGSIQISKGDTLNTYFNSRNGLGEFVVKMDSMMPFASIESSNERWPLKWNKQPNKSIIVVVDVHVLLNSGKEFSTRGLKLKLR